ncbi:uncharacterized protein SPPG_04043 [Spizellomyces punctatus DAOM BR117]|uniref:Uncharacterized protein n=1 Tax=Spizellomyces punctatus (strain DAOM BR117) TaxID=645134 RepID=A0A0L0HIJ1_SPIPD|nr:uncharacterized protein SPPG_04043 [Spizellomyces punctatus DAOM BR117]KND00942.1 hypothetical protein SPPG_04043 [Spizellomyces punctatus DAOM BR117]|eukprot:XP_016608981.1 hypothetical protein SPPG_04043 [Spizellomyces punctatus DAOM BR117]
MPSATGYANIMEWPAEDQLLRQWPFGTRPTTFRSQKINDEIKVFSDRWRREVTTGAMPKLWTRENSATLSAGGHGRAAIPVTQSSIPRHSAKEERTHRNHLDVEFNHQTRLFGVRSSLAKDPSRLQGSTMERHIRPDSSQSEDRLMRCSFYNRSPEAIPYSHGPSKWESGRRTTTAASTLKKPSVPYIEHKVPAVGLCVSTDPVEIPTPVSTLPQLKSAAARKPAKTPSSTREQDDLDLKLELCDLVQNERNEADNYYGLIQELNQREERAKISLLKRDARTFRKLQKKVAGLVKEHCSPKVASVRRRSQMEEFLAGKHRDSVFLENQYLQVGAP